MKIKLYISILVFLLTLSCFAKANDIKMWNKAHVLTDEQKKRMEDMPEDVKKKYLESFWIKDNKKWNKQPGQYNKKAKKSKNYKKFEWELKEKKIFKDKDEIKNKDAVEFLQQRWVINWYWDWSFLPKRSVSRPEALKIILESLWETPKTAVKSSFKDVGLGAWYIWYIEMAKEKWYVKWYSDWTFWVNKTVNKVELLKMLFEAFEIDLLNYWVDNIYSDTVSDSWYAVYVQYAKDNNLLGPESDGLFHPEKWMTRDEFSEVVYRLIQQQENI